MFKQTVKKKAKLLYVSLSRWLSPRIRRDLSRGNLQFRLCLFIFCCCWKQKKTFRHLSPSCEIEKRVTEFNIYCVSRDVALSIHFSVNNGHLQVLTGKCELKCDSFGFCCLLARSYDCLALSSQPSSASLSSSRLVP